MYKIFQDGIFIVGDCLEVMKKIPDNSIDMVLADLPYSTTYADWDKLIPLEDLWENYIKITKKNSPIVLTASQPFTSKLIMSNLKMFRCEWIWNKINGTNFANANKQPLKIHESIVVFSQKQSLYNPQKTLGNKNHKQGSSKKIYQRPD